MVENRPKYKTNGLNNKIEATGIKLGGFSAAGCPCASFKSLGDTKLNERS